MDYRWVHSSIYSSIPPNAVIGGNDSDGAMMYVGRSYHNGDMLVTKILPSRHAAYVSWRGEEVPKEHFEVLCGENLVWQHCYDHNIPESAVCCGTTSIGQPVYVGRGYHEGSLTVGKVSSVHRALFIPYGGAEKRLETYELLLSESKPLGWDVPCTPLEPVEKPPMYTPPPPQWESKPPMYPGLAVMPPPPPPGASADLPPPYVKPAEVYQPGHSFGRPPPPPPGMGYPQPPPPPPPHSHYPPHHGGFYPPPPPPPHHHVPPYQADMWMPIAGNATPANAVTAGHDVDQSTIYVCRAFHDGDLVPGKYVPSHGRAYISHAGQEVPKHNCEVLVGQGRYHWVRAANGAVPSGAVSVGRTGSGEPLYAGRAHYNGSLTPGKVHPSHQCLYLPFGGAERRVTSYEVLVRRGDMYRMDYVKMAY